MSICCACWPDALAGRPQIIWRTSSRHGQRILEPQQPRFAYACAGDSKASTRVNSPFGAGSGLWIKTITRGPSLSPRRTIRARTRLPHTVLSKILTPGLRSRTPSSATVLAGRRIGAATVTTNVVVSVVTPASIACRSLTNRWATRSNRSRGSDWCEVPGGRRPAASALKESTACTPGAERLISLPIRLPFRSPSARRVPRHGRSRAP